MSQSDTQPHQTARSEPPRELALVKDGQRFIFRYEPGGESALLSDVVALANDPDCDVDWMDAAMLSHQLGERMSAQIKQQQRKRA